MNKFLALMAVAVLLFSCKSKAIVTEATVPVTYLKASKIIANHYNNKSDFSTLYIKADAKYSDDRSSQNVTAEIKIKKDEQILVSIRFLGITMAKASITPTSVSYYEKIKGTYFEGDFSALSQWLGTDLDWMIWQITIPKKHSISTQGILVFKNKKLHKQPKAE
jgi:opacity protein-like surface antigen